MLGSLWDWISGWKELRTAAGFSYQVRRGGTRRIVPIEGYRKRGLPDQQWVETGVFADERLSGHFKDFNHTPQKARRQRLAKVDFALTH